MKNHNPIIDLIILILVLVIILATIVIISNNNFNNGICKKCGGHYKLIDAGLYVKYYVCDTCENKITN